MEILIIAVAVVLFILSIQYAKRKKNKLECAKRAMSVILDPELFHWTCHVCGEMRPDSKISVETKTVPIKGTESTIEQNIRYCNDKPKCKVGAKKVDFIRKN